MGKPPTWVWLGCFCQNQHGQVHQEFDLISGFLFWGDQNLKGILPGEKENHLQIHLASGYVSSYRKVIPNLPFGQASSLFLACNILAGFFVARSILVYPTSPLNSHRFGKQPKSTYVRISLGFPLGFCPPKKTSSLPRHPKSMHKGAGFRRLQEMFITTTVAH